MNKLSNQEFEPVSEERAREIMREIMIEELSALAVDQEELRLIKEGYTIVNPVSKEHAEAMIEAGMSYLRKNNDDQN